MSLSVNDIIPNFCLPNTTGGEVCLPDASAKLTVLYFYPKDNTSGCTLEAKEFSELLPKFTELGVKVYGISQDSVASHEKFIQKQELTVPLLSDPDHIAIEGFGVWIQKKLYGREYMGVDRSTFIIDGFGKILASWNKVKAKGHAAVVLQKVQELR
ncbi:MAG: peroxiredoxin [Methanocorpusculum sp.]|uniref:thioredoxin-dependent peroxiredoxin n=1 Tax=Methanocorpusculum petauri TaxID=3002863 RepID=A0ABT4IH48_9EURY|nr:peroxiredoxin [Methanocorpusculum petauri]MDE2442752.1 peroxiredoxin [Methanocorpusculum sp.]MCZ0860881.1 peroxiredoxin [Methanocorpusculum petauri]MDE2519299.1 peroxiredoxin [Methanocorpusculum sp.]MDE2521608.1 peroxiredoxin [Methanocorpusculum sp.]MDE2524189.1 peroxiredoxin [Methanocorpusculum sp.]